jgi:hypothetical protein
MEQKYRYSCKKNKNKVVVVVLDNKLDDHLSRHLSMMIRDNRPSIEITKWLNGRGYDVSELFTGKVVS